MPSLPPDQPGIIRDETGAQTLLGYVVDFTARDGTAKCILHRNEPNYRLSGKRTLLWATITMFFYITMIGVACNIMDADEWPIGIAMWCKLSMYLAFRCRLAQVNIALHVRIALFIGVCGVVLPVKS